MLLIRRVLLRTLVVVGAGLGAGFGAMSAAHAATVWDETVSGDLSNTGTSPTAVSLALGSNIVRGTTGRTNGVVDRDYFTVTLPQGWQLDALMVLPGTTFLGVSGLGFIAVQAGAQVTVNPTGGSPAGLLGWVHYSENDLGSDILGLMGIGMGAAGFATPLPAGTYAFWVQDTGTGVPSYRFDFAVSSVSPVPEPAAALTLLAGLAGVAGLALRRGARGR